MSENCSKTSGFHSSFCPYLSIVTGSSNQDQTLTNELSYFDASNLLSWTLITIDNKTFEEKLKTLLACDSIISKDDSDTEVINQDNPVIANNEEMAAVIPNSQQLSLRDALEVVPFDGSNLPLSPAAKKTLYVCWEVNCLVRHENVFLCQRMQQ